MKETILALSDDFSKICNSEYPNNFYIYSDSSIKTIADMKKYFPSTKEKFLTNIEMFSRQYFSPKLSIKNNLKIICDLHSVDRNFFLKEHNLFSIYEKLRLLKRDSIPINLYIQIMLNLYLFLNSYYFVSMNFAQSLNEMDDVMLNKLNDYFSKNQLFYFSDFYQEKLIKRGIFDYFLVLYDKNKHQIFHEPEDFKKFIYN